MPEQAYTSKFYLIINPGLEDLALDELKSALPDIRNFKKHLGGIEFECELYQGLELNSKLKLPSRILLRLEEFAASDFPKLFKKLQRIAWHGLVRPETPLRFEVSSEKSRLSIKKRIESTAEDAIKKYFKTLKLAPSKNVPDEQRIFLRFVENICTLSIDTSGEHLHKRGYRKLIGEAPLRENLASALLNALFDQGEKLEVDAIELVDPMMGSGTFLLEAYHYFSDSQTRSFAYENWPFVIEEAVGRSQASPKPQEILKIKKLSGFDQDEESIRITQENFKSLKEGAVAKSNAPKFDVVQKNLFENDLPSAQAGVSRYMICNPPYGKRLKVKGKMTDFYSSLFAQCESKLKPEVAGFLISDEVPESQVSIPKSWQLAETLKFKNGGLKVRFMIFKRG